MKQNTEKDTTIQNRRIVIWLCLLIIVVLGSVLRLNNIASSPGWFRDEGNYHAVCESLAISIDPSLGPLNITFCSPFMTHPPFFFYTGAAWLRVFGTSFTSLRVFNVLLSLATLSILFYFLLRFLGLQYAAIGTLLFALHPDIVLFNRMIFPYNLYMLFGFMVFFLAVEYLSKPDLLVIVTASIVAGFAALTVYYAVSLAVIIGVVIIYRRRWRHLPVILIPPGFIAIFILGNLVMDVPGFKEDIAALQDAAAPGTLFQILGHYKDFFLSNVFLQMVARFDA